MPQKNKPKCTIIGAGVIGLIQALELSDQFEVTILAEKVGIETNSRLATAMWHVFLINDNVPLTSDDPQLIWAEETLLKLFEWGENPKTGIELVEGVELFRTKMPASFPGWMDLPEVREGKCNLKFLSCSEIANYNSMDTSAIGTNSHPITYGYKLTVPCCDMEAHLNWLVKCAIESGVKIIKKKIPRIPECLSIAEIKNADYVINCSGIEAENFAGDINFVPYRGEYFEVTRDEDTPNFYVGDDENPLGMAYVVPRGNSVAVGGLAARSSDTNPTVSWSEIYGRARIFYPWLNGKLPKTLDPIVCMRPVRRDGVRIGLDEEIKQVKFFHNYGHGGSGWSLSVGCAREIKKQILQSI